MTSSTVFFVTGAAGFIGRHVCKLLLQFGFKVYVLVRSKDTELSNLGCNVLIGDLWNEALLQKAISSSNIVIHCAGDASFGNGNHYHKANVDPIIA